WQVFLVGIIQYAIPIQFVSFSVHFQYEKKHNEYQVSTPSNQSIPNFYDNCYPYEHSLMENPLNPFQQQSLYDPSVNLLGNHNKLHPQRKVLQQSLPLSLA